MQNACNRMRLSLLPPPPFSLPDLSKKGNFRYRSNSRISADPREIEEEFSRETTKGDDEGREGRKTVKREGKRIRSRGAPITIEEEEKGRGKEEGEDGEGERDRRREGKRRREREEREEGSGRTDRLLLPPHPNFNQDPKYASRMDACEHSRRYYRALRCM